MFLIQAIFARVSSRHQPPAQSVAGGPGPTLGTLVCVLNRSYSFLHASAVGAPKEGSFPATHTAELVPAPLPCSVAESAVTADCGFH